MRLPGLLHEPRRDASTFALCRHIPRHHCSGTENGAAAYPYATQNNHTGAKPYVVFDDDWTGTHGLSTDRHVWRHAVISVGEVAPRANHAISTDLQPLVHVEYRVSVD